MKKKIAMILAMALSLTTLLSACSGTQAKEGDKSSGEKTTVEKLGGRQQIRRTGRGDSHHQLVA